MNNKRKKQPRPAETPDYSRKASWPGSTQLAPLPVVMLGVGDGSAQFPYNLITVAWTGVVNSTPPMLSVSVRKERFSYPILTEKKVFTVNVPTAAMAKKVDLCGVTSGHDTDKFAACHFHAVPGETVSAPVVAECPLALECAVKHAIDLGSHTLFLAEILRVRAAETLIDPNGKFQIEKAGLLSYAHGGYYSLGRHLGHFGYSIRKKPYQKRKKS